VSPALASLAARLSSSAQVLKPWPLSPDERELREAAEGPARPIDFEPPVVTNPRGPISSLAPRNSLDHAAHGGKGPALPDLQGGTHIPEKELLRPNHESQHTALRPSDPNDVTVSWRELG